MRAGIASLTVAALAAALLFSPTAGASELNATFDSANEGFRTLEFDVDGLAVSNEPSDFDASGGNPGGRITFEDPDSGQHMERHSVFIVPGDLDPADYGAEISFDLRSTATDFYSSRFGSVNFSFGSFADGVVCVIAAPTTTWATYSTTIDADEPCWKRTFNGQDATQADIDAALEGSGESLVNADFGAGPTETTDLDNFVIDAPEPRELSLKYKSKQKAFTGKLTGGGEECTSGAEIKLYLKGGEEPLEVAVTSPTGKFSIARRAKKGERYYALAPRITGCAEAESGRVKG